MYASFSHNNVLLLVVCSFLLYLEFQLTSMMNGQLMQPNMSNRVVRIILQVVVKFLSVFVNCDLVC